VLPERSWADCATHWLLDHQMEMANCFKNDQTPRIAYPRSSTHNLRMLMLRQIHLESKGYGNGF
jgi:hypothetical protein